MLNQEEKMARNYNCDGSKCISSNGEVRVYPTGGGSNLILCYNCWANENRYRFNKGREYKRPEDWPQVDWVKARVYNTGDGDD